MQSIKYFGITTIILCIAFFSCKKYPEGPALSLLSKTTRLAGSWKIDKVFENNTDNTEKIKIEFGADYVWRIKKDGTYNESGTINDAGIWRFEDNKESIRFSSADPSGKTYTYKILRLKDKQLWLWELAGTGDVFEIRLKQ